MSLSYIISNHIKSYDIIFYHMSHNIFYRLMSCHVISYIISYYHIMSYHYIWYVTLYYIRYHILYHIYHIIYHISLIIWFDIVLFYVILCIIYQYYMIWYRIIIISIWIIILFYHIMSYWHDIISYHLVSIAFSFLVLFFRFAAPCTALRCPASWQAAWRTWGWRSSTSWPRWRRRCSRTWSAGFRSWTRRWRRWSRTWSAGSRNWSRSLSRRSRSRRTRSTRRRRGRRPRRRRSARRSEAELGGGLLCCLPLCHTQGMWAAQSLVHECLLRCGRGQMLFQEAMLAAWFSPSCGTASALSVRAVSGFGTPLLAYATARGALPEQWMSTLRFALRVELNALAIPE